jgi:hypothetical protein
MYIYIERERVDLYNLMFLLAAEGQFFTIKVPGGIGTKFPHLDQTLGRESRYLMVSGRHIVLNNMELCYINGI